MADAPREMAPPRSMPRSTTPAAERSASLAAPLRNLVANPATPLDLSCNKPRGQAPREFPVWDHRYGERCCATYAVKVLCLCAVACAMAVFARKVPILQIRSPSCVECSVNESLVSWSHVVADRTLCT